MPLALALVIALQTSGAGSGALAAAAQASVRPRECAASTSRGRAPSGPNVWDAAREPNLRRYCDLVARGFAQLPLSPRAARETAELANEVSPGHASPILLAARASVGLGAYDRAVEEFAKAKGLDSRSLDDPGAMRDLAYAQKQTGKLAEALATYRALVPRLAFLPGPDRRALVLLEAADVAMSSGPAALDEAIAFLREAERVPVREARARVLGMLALALDRGGAADEAAARLAEAERLGGVLAIAAFGAPAGPTNEGDPVLALAAEAAEPAAAAKTWEAFLAGPAGKGPWAEHAAKHVEALRKRGRAEPPKLKAKLGGPAR